MPATPASPRLQQVRQQLDDLDTLLERMLALPLDAPVPSGPRLHLNSDPLTLTLDQAGETPPAPAGTIASADSPEPRRETLAEVTEEPAAVVPFVPEPDAVTKLAPAGEPASLVLPSLSAEDRGNHSPRMSPLRESETPAHASVADAGAALPPFSRENAGTKDESLPITPVQLAYPKSAPFASIEETPDLVLPSRGLTVLLACNAGFDWLAERGGWLSRWARTPLGKQLFGGTGLLLCVAAAALALGRWLGLSWR